jgi:hypothetical protein
MNQAATSKHSFRQEIVHRCLTERCQDCSGLYYSDALALEIICYCTCHRHYLQEREYKDSNRLDKRSHIDKGEHYLERASEAVTAAAVIVRSDETVNATPEEVRNSKDEGSELGEYSSAC